MKAYGTERVLIAFDRDEAGDAGGRASSPSGSAPRGSRCFRVLFPRGMDANEYALQGHAGAQSLGVLLRAAAAHGRPGADAWRAGAEETDNRAASHHRGRSRCSSLFSCCRTSRSAPSSLQEDLRRRSAAAAAASPVPPAPAADVPAEVARPRGGDHASATAAGGCAAWLET